MAATRRRRLLVFHSIGFQTSRRRYRAKGRLELRELSGDVAGCCVGCDFVLVSCGGSIGCGDIIFGKM